MFDLSFSIESVEAEKFSASPLLMFLLRITSADPRQRIDNIMLNCQIRLEPTQRAYSPRERERLCELFGASERWSQSVHSLLWTHANVAVPGFEGETRARLPAQCTHDFNVASAKYFYGLTDGEVPLAFLFSGSLFHRDPDGALQIAQIPWSKEARFRLPSNVWRDLMNTYYPDSELLRLDAKTFDRLYEFKRRRSLLTFDDALNELLRHAEAEAR